MTTIYLFCVLAALTLSLFAVVPAVIVAGVALVLTLREEIIWLGGKAANIRAPRPKPVMVRRTAAEADLPQAS